MCTNSRIDFGYNLYLSVMIAQTILGCSLVAFLIFGLIHLSMVIGKRLTKKGFHLLK